MIKYGLDRQLQYENVLTSPPQSLADTPILHQHGPVVPDSLIVHDGLMNRPDGNSP